MSAASLADESDVGTVSSYGELKQTKIGPIIFSEIGVGDSMTPLMRAATLEDPSTLLELIRSKEATSTLFVKDEKGRTALDWARLCNNPLTIIALRKAMVANIEDARVEMIRAPEDLDEKTKYANNIAHMKLTEALKQRRADACIEIINETKDHFDRSDVEKIGQETYFLDIGNHAGFTPLMLAATYNMPDLVALLLDQDVELEVTNKYGYTALSCACGAGSADIVKQLLFNGANLHHKTNEGRTGLHLACMYLKARVVSVLLDFLFERFSTYRMKHPKYGFDSTRWTRYATMMEGYLNIKDLTGKTAWALLPLPESLKAAQLGTRLGVGLGDKALLMPADSLIHRNKGAAAEDTDTREIVGYDEMPEEDDDFSRDTGSQLDGAVEEKSSNSTYEVPLPMPHIDAASIVTISTHQNQLEQHKATMREMMDKDQGVGIELPFSEQAKRAASAGSIARPGGPLPYPPAAKAVSATDMVQLMMADSSPLLDPGNDESNQKHTLPPHDQEYLLHTATIPGLDDEDLAMEPLTPRSEDGLQDGNEDYKHDQGDDAGEKDEEISQGGKVSVQSALSHSTLPNFSHDTDNFVAERKNLVDSHAILTSLALEEEVKIILLLSQQAGDRIEGWRIAAQAEDKLDQKVPCWLNCGFEETVEGVAAHVRDMCPFRGKQCSGCRQIFKFIELQNHRENECPKRAIGCPNAYEGCLEMPAFEFLYQHTHLRCSYRKVPCRLNCGGMIPICKRDDHEEVHCNKRGLECTDCHQIVPAQRFGVHLRDDCMERLVSCSVSCRAKFKAKDVQRHEEEECVQPCKWACGRRIGPAEMRYMHEFIGCPRRPVVCKFGCGLGGLTAEFIAEHEKYQCPEKMQRCPNGCGDRVKRRDMPLHVDSWHGTCPERLVRCPSDFVGWKIYKITAICDQVTPAECRAMDTAAVSGAGSSELQDVADAIQENADNDKTTPELRGSLVKSRLVATLSESKKQGLKSDDVASRDGRKFLEGNPEVGIILKYTRVSLEGNHPHTRPNKRHFDGHDQLLVKFPNRHEVIDFWSLGRTTRLILLQKVQGEGVFQCHKATKFVCGWIACTSLEHHLAFDCTKRAVWLAGEQDKAVSARGQRAEFRNSVVMAERRNRYDEFINAPPTTVTCEFCANDFPPADLTTHQRTACGGVAVRCKLGCGKRMPRNQLEDHATNQCPKRPLTCPQCGEKGMWVDEIDHHLTSECSMRPVSCMLGCGVEGLVAWKEENHRLHICPHRLMLCTCGVKLRVMDHDDHMISDCVDKPTLCPQGCGKTVGRKYVDFHIEFQCSKKGTFFTRMMFCPVGCGQRMMKKDIIYHATYICHRRLTDCPLGCGQSIQFEKLRIHLYFCPKRPICCEPGMKQCNKLFFKWFYDDGGVGRNNSGVQSEEGEEALLTDEGMTDQVDIPGLVDDDPADQWDNASAISQGSTVLTQSPQRPSGQTVGFFNGQASLPQSREQVDYDPTDMVPYNANRAQSAARRKKTPSSRPGTTTSRPTTAKLLGIDPDILPVRASITVVESRMFLKPKLRLKGCKRHGATALMAACRMNELPLGIFIVKSTEGMDMEMESSGGETALTLACRLGRLDFVELLVQNGADVNYETSLGKTALIESVRAPVAHLNIVEFLVAAGALVSYKTNKHGRSAMEWSKLLMLPDIVRALELGEVVQRQTTLLFNAIGCHDNDKIRQIIGHGDFFHPNNEKIMYDRMEAEIAITRQAHVDVVELKKSMRDLTTDVERRRSALELAQNEFDESKNFMEDKFRQQDALTLALSKLFTKYEHIADTLLRSDLEELGRLRRPDVAVRGAVFCYGVMMGYLALEAYPQNDFSLEHAKKWWPMCTARLRDSQDALKRLRAFSLDRLRTILARPLLERARSMYRDLTLAIEDAKHDAISRAPPSRASSRGGGSRSGTRGNSKGQSLEHDDDTDGVNHPVAIQPWGKNSSIKSNANSERFSKNPQHEEFASPERLSLLMLSDTDDLKGIRPRTHGRNPLSPNRGGESSADPADKKSKKAAKEERKRARQLAKKRAEDMEAGDSDSASEGIPDYEWDSEAEGAGEGSFVKGVWVPVSKKKEKWWIREPKKGSKEEADMLKKKDEDEKLAAEKEAKRQEVQKKFGQPPKKYTFAKKAPPPPEPIDPTDTHRGRAISRGSTKAIIVNLANRGSLEQSATAEQDSSIKSLRGAVGDAAGGDVGDSSLVPDSENIASDATETSPSVRPVVAAVDPIESAYNSFMADSASGHFVRCILVLLKAANQLAEDQESIKAMKDSVVAMGQHYDEKRQAHQAAHVAFMGSQSKRLMTEKNLIDMIRYSRFTLKRARGYREKLRVSRLLNKICAGGHTAISYAAALGNYDAVELLLTHGATAGYNSQLLHLSASYLQLSYRLYRFVTEAKREGIDSAKDKFKELKKQSKRKLQEAAKSGGAQMGDVGAGLEDENNEDADASIGTGDTTKSSQPRLAGSIKSDVTVMGEFQAATSAQLIEKMFAMKEHRAYILSKIKFFRSKMRFPVPEAAYNGKWEIIRRFIERRLFHANFSSTWVMPAPPPPYIRHFYRFQAKPEKYDMLTCLALGMNNISSGSYVEMQGWVGPNDPRDHFGLAQEYLQELSRKLKAQRANWAQERYRIRCLALERIKASKAIPEFCRAVQTQDWRACMYYATNMGVSIDHESEVGGQGVTCLIAAAEEDTGRLNYAPMLGDDGNACLAVEYLLDRTAYRPQVNLELSDPCAHTALIRSASLGRSAALQALIDRGAVVNHVNRLGKVALHYAAESGNYDCVRILLERGADQAILTADGRSAYDIADEFGFQNVVKAISRFGNGFLGPVRVSRGKVDELVRCPLGCGKDMLPYDVNRHLQVCMLRIVVCPMECGERLLMAKELEEHQISSCIRRKVFCEDCQDPTEFRHLVDHKAERCIHRYVDCNLGCGQQKKVYEMKKHLKFCTWRIVPCQLACGLEVRVCQMSAHVKSECPYRRLPCPLNCSSYVTSNLMFHHINNVCPLRLSHCRYCNAELVYKETEIHERTCHVREEPCPAACGQLVCITETKLHMATVCAHRFVPCPQKCNQKVRFVDIPSHCAHLCDARLIPCPLKCLVSDDVPVLEREISMITAKMIDLHVSIQCPERLVQCINCRQDIKAKVAKSHKDTSCTMRPVPCRNPGCSKQLPLGEQEDHERKQCKFKLVVCPQGCGELVAAIFAGKHMMLTCSWRYSKCPLGCGETMRHRQLHEHMKVDCVRRHNISSAEYGSGGNGSGIGGGGMVRQASREKKSSSGERGEKKGV